MNHFNAAERHGARNQIQRIAGRTANPVGQLSGRANAAHGFCLAVGSAALFNAPVPAGGASVTYGCMKCARRMTDAGSIPARSTTEGLQGFDGMLSAYGQPAMVPAALGSPGVGVRCDGPKPQTPTTAFIGLRRQPDVPAARNGTQGRHLCNAPRLDSASDAGLKPETCPAYSPVCAKGGQDNRAGSTLAEEGRRQTHEDLLL